MAEAEDVIVDAARHATAFLQAQWRKRSPAPARCTALADHVQRLELLLAAAFGAPLKIRPAQPITDWKKACQTDPAVYRRYRCVRSAVPFRGS